MCSVQMPPMRIGQAIACACAYFQSRTKLRCAKKCCAPPTCRIDSCAMPSNKYVCTTRLWQGVASEIGGIWFTHNASINHTTAQIKVITNELCLVCKFVQYNLGDDHASCHEIILVTSLVDKNNMPSARCSARAHTHTHTLTQPHRRSYATPALAYGCLRSGLPEAWWLT
jgi:hypothetical protein